MKKLTLFIATALLLFFLVPNVVKAAAEENPVTNAAIETVDAEATMETVDTEATMETVDTEATLETVDTEAALDAESEALLVRLEEINEMDKSDLTRSEKKELRKEVREIDKTLALNGGGVYLSVGAIIIVILLLILLL
jgi:hypothetical protein